VVHGATWEGSRVGVQIPPDDPRLLPVQLRRELLGQGETDRTLAAALKAGRLDRPRRGAYCDAPAWLALSDEEKYAVRCRAAYQQSCTGVVLSHVSALPFHGGPLWGLATDEVHLTRADGLSGRREAGIRRHRGSLYDGDVVEIHGLSVMSALRATLEVSMFGSTEAALAVANHFLHEGEFSSAELRERYERSMNHWPESGPTEVMIRLADPRIESVGESRSLYFFYQHGFPKPVPQYEVRDGDRVIARLDFAFPDLGFWVEFDGRVKYDAHLRPGETPVDVVLREKRREQQIAEATGWRCFRITWADLAEPERLARRLRAFMRSVATERSRRLVGPPDLAAG
jgi:hypothetical protein